MQLGKLHIASLGFNGAGLVRVFVQIPRIYDLSACLRDVMSLATAL